MPVLFSAVRNLQFAMPRVSPPDGPIHPHAQAELDRQLAEHGRITNMKKMLSRSPAALHALMQWYPLRDEVASFLGERATTLLAHAVSAQADCLICSTYFRRLLIDAGDDPDNPQLDDKTAAVLAYGRALARDANEVSNHVYDAAAKHFTQDQLVALTAFAAMMIATNIFNNALEIELDSYLWNYRKTQDASDQGAR
jgi:alkylhydroperoxidase family enzyme